MPSNLRSFAHITLSLLRRGRYAPLSWGLSLGLFCALIVLIWPSIETSLSQALSSYPETLKEAFAIKEISSAVQYLDVEMMSLIVPLALAFFAIRSAAAPIVNDESRGQIDAFLSLPVDRRVLFVASFIATTILVIAILAVIWLTTVLSAVIFAVDFDLSAWTEGVVNVLPLCMAFAGLALFLSGLLHSPTAVVGIASGLLALTYIVDLLGKISPEVKPYRFLSAYRYYGSAIQDGLSYSNASILIAAAFFLVAVGALLFQRRDVFSG